MLFIFFLGGGGVDACVFFAKLPRIKNNFNFFLKKKDHREIKTNGNKTHKKTLSAPGKTFWSRPTFFVVRAMADPDAPIGFACVEMVDRSDDMESESDDETCDCCGWCWLGHICLRMTWGCCCACADIMSSAKM
jgi:hypothetical protein